MSNEMLIKDLLVAALSSNNDAIIMEKKFNDVLAEYSITKLVTTAPSTGDGSTTKFLIEQYMKAKVQEGISEGSMHRYFEAIHDIWEYSHIELNMFKEEDIINYLNFYRFHNVKGGEKKPNTVRNRHMQLSAVLSWLYKHNYIANNPMQNMKCPKQKRTLKKVITSGEMEKITINCEQEKKGIKLARDMAIVTFLYDSGVRVSECCNLKIKDIDFDKKSVSIHHGKGDSDRVTYFFDSSKERLLEYLSYRDYTPDDYLFTHYWRNQGLKPDGIRDVIKKIDKNTQINRLHPHLFRDSFATNLIKKGVSAYIVKDLLGHASLETLNSYIFLSENDVINALNVME